MKSMPISETTNCAMRRFVAPPKTVIESLRTLCRYLSIEHR